MIEWYIGPIEKYTKQINELFYQNKNHKLWQNYLIEKNKLFEHTMFARIGFVNNKVIYYSAGIKRPQYNNSIRIMSRHTRSRTYNFGTKKQDLARGLETLDSSVEYAQNLSYTNIWVSREFNNNLLKWFKKNSKFNWTLSYEKMHYGGYQHILSLEQKNE